MTKILWFFFVSICLFIDCVFVFVRINLPYSFLIPYVLVDFTYFALIFYIFLYLNSRFPWLFMQWTTVHNVKSHLYRGQILSYISNYNDCLLITLVLHMCIIWIDNLFLNIYVLFQFQFIYIKCLCTTGL